ncbi:hypothetical protein COBT_002700 [Conglomerata obtusa]
MIGDVSFFYACLNVLNILLQKDWNIIANKEITHEYKFTEENDHINRIVRNEIFRQNFYKILLFIARPFVSKKRYEEVLCKNIFQDLFVTHFLKYSKNEEERFKCFQKFVFFHLFEIFTFEKDDIKNELIDEKKDHNIINETMSQIIEYKSFENLGVKFKNPIFRLNFVNNISYIQNSLNIVMTQKTTNNQISNYFIECLDFIRMCHLESENFTKKINIDNISLNTRKRKICSGRSSKTYLFRIIYYEILFNFLCFR